MSKKANPVDDALDDSFPASDPSSHSGTTTASPSQSVVTGAGDQGQFSVWRIVDADQKEQPFQSPGLRSSRRWTSDKVDVIYVADSPATALLEWLAHLEGEPPSKVYVVEGRLSAAHKHSQTALPSTWKDYPYTSEVQTIGDSWIQSGESLALQVPSALCPGSCNYLVNPHHPSAGDIEPAGTQEFDMDMRLIK